MSYPVLLNVSVMRDPDKPKPNEVFMLAVRGELLREPRVHPDHYLGMDLPDLSQRIEIRFKSIDEALSEPYLWVDSEPLDCAAIAPEMEPEELMDKILDFLVKHGWMPCDENGNPHQE